MADTTGDTPSDLENKLFNHIESFSFFQAVRIFKHICQKKGDSEDTLRIRPSLSFEFPSSDIVQLHPLPDKTHFELITTFLGLYGFSSPLPSFYTDDLIEAELDDQTAGRAILDIIHQRLYSLFYQALKKYHPLYQVVEDKQTGYSDLLFSLLGLRIESISNKFQTPHHLLKYISLFNQQPRSALGLKTLLEDAFPGYPVDIIQCVSRKIKIGDHQRSALGQKANILGDDSLLGETVEDCTGKIAIAIGPMKRRQFHNLLNNNTQWKDLITLIQLYLIAPIECNIELIIEDNEAKTAKLGNRKWSCLGKDAWLFSSSYHRPVRAIMHINLPNRPIQ